MCCKLGYVSAAWVYKDLMVTLPQVNLGKVSSTM